MESPHEFLLTPCATSCGQRKSEHIIPSIVLIRQNKSTLDDAPDILAEAGTDCCDLPVDAWLDLAFKEGMAIAFPRSHPCHVTLSRTRPAARRACRSQDPAAVPAEA
jgi:hypothetical protein